MSLANTGVDGRRSGSNPRQSKAPVDMAAMKNAMAGRLDNAIGYEDKVRVNTGGIGSGRAGSNKRPTGMTSPKGSPMSKRQNSAGRR